MKNTVQRIAVWCAICLFAGCAQTPLRTVQKAGVRSVIIQPKVEKPEGFNYVDSAIQATRSVGAVGGLVGALITEGIVAGVSKEPRKRFEAVMQQNGMVVPLVVRQAFERELERSRLLEIRQGGPADGVFTLAIQTYGVIPGEERGLRAVLILKADLRKPGGKVVWSRRETSQSKIEQTLAEFEANPRRFAEAFQQAAEAVARQMVSDSQGE